VDELTRASAGLLADIYRAFGEQKKIVCEDGEEDARKGVGLALYHLRRNDF
jgi:hypothetical protein